jgi:hypothetical protein
VVAGPGTAIIDRSSRPNKWIEPAMTTSEVEAAYKAGEWEIEYMKKKSKQLGDVVGDSVVGEANRCKMATSWPNG